MAQTRDDETEKRSQTDAEASQETGRPEEDVDTGPAPEGTEAELTAPEHDPTDNAPELVAPEHDPREEVADPAAAVAIPEEELTDLDEESPLAAGDDRLQAEETPNGPPADTPPPAAEAEPPARRGGFGPGPAGGRGRRRHWVRRRDDRLPARRHHRAGADRSKIRPPR